MSTSKRILVIAGEVSGDRLAAKALQETVHLAMQNGSSVEISGIAGNETAALGANILFHSDRMSVIGFVEVMKRYRFFRSVMRTMIRRLDDAHTRPDVVFLVDYPGFNIRMAAEAHKRGIRVVYYVSPQVWAWKKKRITSLVQNTDAMLVIFPFETELYRKAGHTNVRFVGHPLVTTIDAARTQNLSKQEFGRTYGLDAKKQWLVIYPGSRRNEIDRHLHIMVEAARRFDRHQEFEHIIMQAPGISLPAADNSTIISGDAGVSYNLLSLADLGIFKSGTTTLEAALLGVPGVICYKTSALTYAIAKRLITLPYIGLANIALGRKLYPELVQHTMTAEKIAAELSAVQNNADEFLQAAHTLHQTLRNADGSSPSTIVAEELLT